MNFKDRIIECIDKGNTASQIFKEFDLSYMQIRQYITLEEWDVIVSNTYNNFQLPVVDIVYNKNDFYYDDIYFYTVIKKFGYVETSKVLNNISTGYIRNVCKRLGILKQLSENNQLSKSISIANNGGRRTFKGKY